MNAYRDLAKTEVVTFVERSTRFVPGQISFSGESTFVASFRVDVRHQLSSKLVEETLPGQVSPEHDDLLVESSEEYAVVAESIKKEAEGRLDTLRELAGTIEKGQYADHVDKFEFRRYHRRVIFTFACGTCIGTGSVTCSSCRGGGSESCSFCGGRGSNWVMSDSGSSSMGSHSESCRWCTGSGDQSCSQCSGGGTETCGTCFGHAELTAIATPALVVEPNYSLSLSDLDDQDVVHALVSYATIPCVRKSWAEARTRIVAVHEERRCVIETVEFICPFFKSYVTVNKLSSFVVVFGRKCGVSDAGHLIEKLVHPDLEKLSDSLGRLRWFDIPMTRYAQQIAKIFMESEIHQMAVELAPAHGNHPASYTALASKLSKSLTPVYIDKALSSIERLATWTSRGYAHAVLLFALVLGLPLLMLLIRSNMYWSAALACIGVFLVSSALRWWLTKLRLRWIGGQRLVDFASRRGIYRPSLLNF